jgi:hypothetical protein
MKPLFAASAALVLAAAPAPPGTAQAPQPAAAAIAGTWDLIWQTRKGPRREGWFVITRQGAALRGEIHGRGSVKAKGNVSGSDFTLRGSRMAVPYTITGRVAGNRMEGTLKVLSVTRHFTGTRRPWPGPGRGPADRLDALRLQALERVLHGLELPGRVSLPVRDFARDPDQVARFQVGAGAVVE